MIAFLVFLLEVILIVLKAAGHSTLGWVGTFMPLIAYGGLLVAVFAFGLLLVLGAGVAAWFSTK